MRFHVRSLLLAPLGLALLAAGTALWLLAPGRGDEARADFLTGKITVSSTAITDQEGKILVVTATPAAGGNPIARACYTITSDPFEAPPTVMTDIPGGNGPCDGTTAETVFEEGQYTIFAGVFSPGSQTPDASVQIPITLTGDMEVVIDGQELSGEPLAFGDVDCDSDVDSVDALKLLRHVAGLSVSQNDPCPDIGTY
jgi:hypothetical protein